MTDSERLDIAAVWRHAGWPVVHDDAARVWVLGEGTARRAAALSTLQAPDFELPDLGGRMHRLSQYRGRRVFMVAWASWCGCRLDLPVWQSLMESTREQEFTVLAVALDEPEAARPWIEAASPTYPCLIDREHRVAELYHLVNVPQAVWIDEQGRLVRPPENAGSTEGFREMDWQTFEIPAQALAERQRVKQLYAAAVKDWAQRGAASPHALDEAAVTSRLHMPDSLVSEAPPGSGWRRRCCAKAGVTRHARSSPRRPACIPVPGRCGGKPLARTTAAWPPAPTSGRGWMPWASGRTTCPSR